MRTEEGRVYSRSLKIPLPLITSKCQEKAVTREDCSLRAIFKLFEITTEAQPDAQGSGSAGPSVADQSRAARGCLG